MGAYGHTLYLMVSLITQFHSLIILLSLCVQYIMFYNQHFRMMFHLSYIICHPTELHSLVILLSLCVQYVTNNN